MAAREDEATEGEKGWVDFNFCRVPVNFMDFYLRGLSKAEMLVIFYIIRRTFGFDKRRDAISYSQFLNGICTKEGRWLDYGTGLSRKSLVSALDSLVKKRVIRRYSRLTADSGRAASVYELNLDYILSSRPAPPSAERGQEVDKEHLTGTDRDATGPCQREAEPEGKGAGPFSGPDNSATPGVKTSPTPGVKFTPTIDSLYQNKVKQHIDSYSGMFDDMPLELIKAGIWPEQARRLAAKVRSNGRDMAYLQGWTGWLQGRSNVRNPAAFLVKVLESNADPPGPARPHTFPLADPIGRYREEHRRRTEQLMASARKYGLVP